MARSNTGLSTAWLSNGAAVLTAAPILIAGRVLLNGTSNFYNVAGLAKSDATQYHFIAASGGGSPSFRLFTQDGSGEVGAICAANYSAAVWYVVGAMILGPNERYITQDAANEGSNTSSRTPTLNRTYLGALRDESGGSTFGAIDGELAEWGVWDLSAYGGTNTAQKAAGLDILRGLTAGYSPAFFQPGRKTCWHLFGNGSPEPDVDGGFPLTVNGTMPKADHPANVYYPALTGIGFAESAAVTPTLAAPTLTGTWRAYVPRVFPLVLGADEWYCIGLADHPAVRAGETLSDPACTTPLTQAAGPTVLTSAFIGRTPAGTLATIAAGKGVKVRLTGAAGLYDVAILVSASGGERIGTKFQVSVE